MNPPYRFEIEKFANEKFQADLERRTIAYALKQAQAVAPQVKSSGNSGGYLPALIQCKQEKLREEILALADAWVEAGTIYAVSLQVWAEEALEKAAVLMAAGTVSALRGELDLMAKRTRNPQSNAGAGVRAIESAMKSALREGKLRLKTQRIQARRSSSWQGATAGEASLLVAMKLQTEERARAEDDLPRVDLTLATEPSGNPTAGTEEVPTGNETNPARSNEKGRKRGPKRDYERAARVNEIVAQVAPDGDWRSKVDEICEALDEAQIPFPPRWRKRDRSCDGWAAYDERANAVKAIEYQLQMARQRNKHTPETLS